MRSKVTKILRWLRYPRHRPWLLLVTVAIAILGVLFVESLATLGGFAKFSGWLADRPFFGPLFFPSEIPDWKDRLAALIPIIGLPVAFLIWHWRDRNAQDQIENQRKDINLKEFQEVQLRAVGVVGGETPNNARYILQIAALHQLRGFLKGEYGEGFRRPAFETYSALLSRADASEWQAGEEDDNMVPYEIFRAVRDILYEDWKWFFWQDYGHRIGWPLSGRSIQKIRLPSEADLSDLDLSRVNFYDSFLDSISLDRARCWNTNFSNCNLRGASLIGASCDGAKFDDTDLAGAKASWADMSGTSLKRTKFHASDFASASFAKAVGANCDFVNTKLCGANFNGASFNTVDFGNSDLAEAKFVSARIINGSIAGSNLTNCDFSYAHLDGFYPSSAKSCNHCLINGKTVMPHSVRPFYDRLLRSERQEAIAEWQKYGAVYDPTGERQSQDEDDRIAADRARNEAIERVMGNANKNSGV